MAYLQRISEGGYSWELQERVLMPCLRSRLRLPKRKWLVGARGALPAFRSGSRTFFGRRPSSPPVMLCLSTDSVLLLEWMVPMRLPELRGRWQAARKSM